MMYQNNNPYANNLGYTYGVPRPQARNTQPLTPDQIAKLRQDSNAFDMKVEVEDLWRAACTHKEKNGQSTLVDKGDGTYVCTICHEEFKMCDSTKDEIKEAVNTLINMLQTSKTVYLDAPEELIKQYYQIIPLLKKFPDLWDRAIKNFSMYEGSAVTSVNPMYPGYSGYAALQTLLTNPYAGYGYQAAPQQPAGYGYQQPAAGFYGQPMAPAYGAPVADPSGNPMAYGVPGNIPAPTAPAPGVMPGAAQPAPAAAPAAATAPQAEVQQQQVFNV